MARKETGTIEVDTLTTLKGVPTEAWEYRLGTYSALEWVLERYKEKKPKDPTIAEKFNTYRFADYKEQVIDLLGKVCRVSVETMKIIGEMGEIGWVEWDQLSPKNGHKMSNKKNLNEVINNVSAFIKSIRNAEDFTSAVMKSDLFFSIADEGTWFLSGEEAKNYLKILQLLIDFVQDETISRVAIEKIFQKAILTVLDISEKRKEKSFDQNLEDALNDLRKLITATPIPYNVYYPVHGLALDGLPIDIGNVQFCQFDDTHLAVFNNMLIGGDGDDETKNMNAYIADQIKQADINGKPIGLIDVKAIDPGAAKLLALKELS